jgi:PAS domain S-box-containing protein
MPQIAESDLGQALIEHLADAVIFADRDGLIRVWNGGAEAVFGYSTDDAEQAIGTLIAPLAQQPALGHNQYRYPADLQAIPWHLLKVLGRRLDVLIPERLRPAHWSAFDAAIDTGQMKHGRESMTTRSIHKDGSDLYLDLSFALVKEADGQIIGSVAVARDITTRSRAEKAPRRRIADLEAQIEALTKRDS